MPTNEEKAVGRAARRKIIANANAARQREGVSRFPPIVEVTQPELLNNPNAAGIRYTIPIRNSRENGVSNNYKGRLSAKIWKK